MHWNRTAMHIPLFVFQSFFRSCFSLIFLSFLFLDFLLLYCSYFFISIFIQSPFHSIFYSCTHHFCLLFSQRSLFSSFSIAWLSFLLVSWIWILLHSRASLKLFIKSILYIYMLISWYSPFNTRCPFLSIKLTHDCCLLH